MGAVSHELLAALPDRDTLRLYPRWRTCALVGPHTERGAHAGGRAIDAADAVIRVAPPAGAHAGQRTTVLVLSPAASAAAVAAGATDRRREGLQRQEMRAAVQLHLVTSPAALNATLRWQRANPRAAVAIADPELHQLALDSHGGKQPPAAFYALLLATARCGRVVLHGFTCSREERAAAEGVADSAERLAVLAEERMWRVLMSRLPAGQFAFAAEGAAPRT